MSWTVVNNVKIVDWQVTGFGYDDFDNGRSVLQVPFPL